MWYINDDDDDNHELLLFTYLASCQFEFKYKILKNIKTIVMKWFTFFAPYSEYFFSTNQQFNYL